jgi:acyl-CoA thioester hydrolase
MARIKINLPEQFPFYTEIPVRITDLNAARHLGNVEMMGFIHEARMRFLMHFGLNEMDVFGAGLIQVDAAVVFKSQAFYGDKVKIEVAAGDFSATGCDFFYRLSHVPSGREIARAKTFLVFFDYETQKKLPVPASFKTLFQNK